MYNSAVVTIPLAAAGRLNASTRAIYDALGIETDVLLVGECEYTVLSSAADEAFRAIVNSYKPRGAPIPLHSIVIPHVAVPVYQPRIGDPTATLYKLLGINTFELVQDKGPVLTVLAGKLAVVKKALSQGPPETPDREECGVPCKQTPPALVTSVPVAGLILQDFYLGEPEPRVLEIARLFGVQFARIQSGRHEYWVLKRPAAEFMATLERLRLFA